MPGTSCFEVMKLLIPRLGTPRLKSDLSTCRSGSRIPSTSDTLPWVSDSSNYEPRQIPLSCRVSFTPAHDCLALAAKEKVMNKIKKSQGEALSMGVPGLLNVPTDEEP